MNRARLVALAVVLAGCTPSHPTRPFEDGAAPVTSSSAVPAAASNSSAAPLASGSGRSPSVAASAAPAQPPPVERACTRDADCAVAHIEVSGPGVCCSACVTTPGTRSWYARLRRFCAKPLGACPPLGCPMGPTRAVCQAGRCEATPTGADGKPVFIMDERRCVPALVCDGWQGCAEISGNEQDGWFVERADDMPAGTAVTFGNVCTSGVACDAVTLRPDGVQCPPWGIPPLIAPPPFACAGEAGACRKVSPGASRRAP